MIHGIWDHIKNSGEFDAANMTLEWVGSVPGKREYRRFLGDHVLHQGDILDQTELADRVAFGCWSIDLHPPKGMYSDGDGAKQRYAEGIYHIPYRSLHSVNTTNLLLAGRNISASHVAFGSTRVMATCATVGQAPGTAAALCAAQGVAPRALDVPAMQRTLLREDASVVGLASSDPDDLALGAAVTASSSLTELGAETLLERLPTTTSRHARRTAPGGPSPVRRTTGGADRCTPWTSRSRRRRSGSSSRRPTGRLRHTSSPSAPTDRSGPAGGAGRAGRPGRSARPARRPG
ncbi:FAD-dependent oxidoreductase [Streptomyces sp. NPDC056255]|uniref:FAD-dependent oxidoreductase n=1 Tax=Streptomyces sp. NPDC056255 TaxID=3345764 RepID=UPI0035D89677